jgi:tetratricopeptide (TPR) repeat protein
LSQWMLWLLLSWVTGSPLTALLILAVLWLLGDRLTFRVLPDPLRAVARWRRRGRLRATLRVNPHDRRARFELCELLLDARRPREAAEVLRPNVLAGDDDVRTAFAMGAALGRSGEWEPAERALEVARAQDPRFRLGELDLELGRQRLARGDFAGAREALQRLVAERPGTVEGRYHLARALSGLGEEAAAWEVRREALREYRLLPRFHRRQERPFAWRIDPWRPAAVALVMVAVVVLAVSALALAPSR